MKHSLRVGNARWVSVHEIDVHLNMAPAGGAAAAMLALASCCLVLMYKVAICHPSTSCYAISGTLFPISGGRPAQPVPSPAAISLLSLL
jgi:hypothetical protein